MERFLQNLGHALRALWRQPGFTLMAVLTLALGIGANTAMFSVVHGVVLKPLPYPQSERLVEAGWLFRESFFGMDQAQFGHFVESQRSLESIAARTPTSVTLGGEGGSERLRAMHVSADYFRVLGVQPALGRAFQADDDRVAAAPTTVIDDALWRRRFNADPEVLGRTLRLDGIEYTVIGVMPRGFRDTAEASVYVPLAPVAGTVGQGTNYTILGRLAEGVGLAQAQEEMEALAAGWQAATGWGVEGGVRFALLSYQQAIAREVRTPLLLLSGAIGLVLLIACANVANLLVVRGAARSREIAIRSALGASRARLGRLVLTESLLIALMGGLAGLVVAYFGADLLVQMRADSLPRVDEVRIDIRVFGFSLLLAVGTGLLVGLPSALQAGSGDLSGTLKGAAAGGARRTPMVHLRQGLVIGQVSLAMVLLVGAGLLIQTFANLNRVDPGFDPGRVLAAQFWTSGTRHGSSEEIAAFADALSSRVAAVPGVSAVGVVAAGLPLERGGNIGVAWAGQGTDEGFGADYRSVSAGYFDALGLRLLRGRVVGESDTAQAPKVAVVNDAFARRHLRDEDPLGRHLRIAEETWEIVGVVADVRSHLDRSVPPTVFLPLAQTPVETLRLFEDWFPMNLVVGAGAGMDPFALTASVSDAFRVLDADVPTGRVTGMEAVLARSIGEQRFNMSLMAAFAGLALLLAAIGVYSVLAYLVTRRTREIGIQVALGAGRREVVGMVLRQGMGPVAIGLALGSVGAMYLSRFLGGMLFEVAPFSVPVFLLVAAVLAAVAVLACLLPALNASRVEPMLALRTE